jgi:hypothetical protein
MILTLRTSATDAIVADAVSHDGTFWTELGYFGASPTRRAVGYILIAFVVALLIRAVRPIGGDCITNAVNADFTICIVGVALIYACEYRRPTLWCVPAAAGGSARSLIFESEN